MTPMRKRSLALQLANLATLAFLFVAGGAIVAAVGPARTLLDSRPDPHLKQMWEASAHQPAALPGDIVAVAGYNGVPGTGTLGHAPAGGVPAHVLYVPWTDLDSTLFVQNTESSNSATLTASFYDLAGSLVTTHMDSIPAAGSLELPLASMSTLPPGYEGGAILESDWPIVAAVNVQPSTSNSLLSYNASQAPDLAIVLPELMKDYYEWNTSFWVQNAGASPADVTMAYYAYGSGLVLSSADTIPPGTSHVYRQASMPALGINFYGLVLIQATEPVVVVAEARNSLNPAAFAYSGIAQLDTDAFLLSPRQQRAVDGWSSGTSFVNPGASLADVSANWYSRDGSTSWNQMGSVPLQDGLFFHTLAVPGIPNGFDGSLIAEASQPLASLVHWMNSSLAGDGHGANPAIGLSTLGTSTYLPRVAHSVSMGTATELSIQDPGPVAADVTITFYDQSGAVSATVNDTIPPLGVHRYGTGDVSGLGDEWQGSAIVASTQPAAVEVMQYLVGVGTCPVVSDPADSGPGTLRDCLERATAGDTITFDPAIFPPGSPVSITLESGLPAITQGDLTIDGSAAGVILDGGAAGLGVDGLVITSDGNAIKGLQILYFSGNGITIADGANNTIGGSNTSPETGCTGDCNLISGNQANGLVISGSGATDNTVSGNLVGLDVSGAGALGNGSHGITILVGAQNNIIGGATPEKRNVIASNGASGVRIDHPGTASNIVKGNYVGTDISGTVARGNTHPGVAIAFGATENQVGGVAPGEGNLISGNNHNGIQISDSGTMSNTVIGNYIGTDAAGTSALPNTGFGVFISGNASHNMIGGPSEAERNIITYNQLGGVTLTFGGTDGNTIQGNWIGVDVDGTRQAAVALIAHSPAYGSDRTIFVGTEGQGVFKTTDGGDHWTEANTGLTDLYIDALAISPDYATDQTVFAGTEAGLFKSTDGGASWLRVSPEKGGNYILSVAFSPDYGNDQTVLMGTYLQWNADERTWVGGVWKSSDGGTTWANLAPASGLPQASNLATMGLRGGNLPDMGKLWSPGSGPGLVPLGQDLPLWIGEQEGMSVQQDEGFIAGYAVAFSPDYALDQTLFVGTHWDEGSLYMSTDGGETWSMMNAGLEGSSTRQIAVSPDFGSDQTLYVMDTDQAGARPFRSTDGGTNWTELTSGLPGDDSLALGFALSPDFATDDVVFASFCYPGGDPRGFFRSDDRGDSWVEASPGIQQPGRFGVLAVSPNYAADGQLLLSAERNGLLLSDDEGNTWVYANGDMTDPGNGGSGISIMGGSRDNIIGGDSPGARNLISKNGAEGVVLEGPDTSGNIVAGNYIGTDASGAASLGNSGTGVDIRWGALQNRVGGGNSSPGGGCSGACNLISGNGGVGIRIGDDTSEHNLVSGNYIGTTYNGTDALGNNSHGVQIADGASNNTIGGVTPAERNLISGNVSDGIEINGGPDGNIISGNYVGTDASGTSPVGNGYYGINIYSGYNLIGGDNASPGEACSGACNLVSGNSHGIQIVGSSAVSNTVTGNYVGTDVDGTTAIPSLGWDHSNNLQIDGAHNRVGGATPAERNVVAGPIYIAPPYMEPTHNQIIGNYLGVDATGTACIANGYLGISVWGSDHVIGGDTPAEGNWICGYDGGGIYVNGTGNKIAHNKIFDTPEEGIEITGSGNLVAHNEIYGNGTEGVRVEGETALTNTLTGNSIYDNALLGIDLVDGGNTELRAPVVLSYDAAAGTASGTACALCTVEIFGDDSDEGRWYEGTETADALGTWAFSKGAPFSGAHVHATATDAEGNTSEFSRSMHDVAVVGVAPSGEVPVGQASGIYAQLLNEGSQPESNVPVRCAIQNTGYDEIRTSGQMQPVVWAMVEFPAWTPPAAGVYTLTCQSMLSGDENPDNDLYTQVVTATLAGQPDVWTRDNDEDTGDVPSNHPWWVSPDIWVRHQDDGGLIHQNPIAFQDNTVYVRLRNRGSRATSGEVKVFWDRSRIGWPCKVGQPSVGTIPFENLAPGEVRIVSLQWEPQEVGHHGLHTVIEAEGDPADWSAPCSPHLPRWDNNVSWHNVIVYMHPAAGDRRVLSVEKVEVDLVNIYDWPKDMDLIVERGSFPATGAISLRLDEELFDRWWSYEGRWTEDVQVDEATKVITISGEVSATIGGLPLKAKEEVTATLVFDAPGEGAFDAQMDEHIDDVVIGGISYQWIDSDDTPPDVQTTLPLNEAAEVALDAPIVVTFTEQIGPLSLDLALEPDPGGWHLAWNDNGTVLTATRGRFEPATTYTATVTARDAFANAMEAPYAWTFTVREGYWIYLPLLLRNH